MPRYMMLITHPEDYRNQDIPQGLLDEMGTFATEKLKSGTLIDTAGLEPTSRGTRVRLSRGKLSFTDGPFTETKEVVGGYAIIEAYSREHAVELATEFMEIHRKHWPEFEGACEVRALEGGGSTPPVEATASHAANAVRASVQVP